MEKSKKREEENGDQVCWGDSLHQIKCSGMKSRLKNGMCEVVVYILLGKDC